MKQLQPIHSQRKNKKAFIPILIAIGLLLTLCPITHCQGLNPEPLLNINLNTLSKETTPQGILKAHISILNVYDPKDINITMTYSIKTADNELRHNETESINMKSQTESYIKEIPLENITNLTAGNYYLHTIAQYESSNATKTTRASSTFQIHIPFWTPEKTKMALSIITVLSLLTVAYYTHRWYKKRKLEKSRYLFPMDYKKLPHKDDRSLWLGKIAETDIKAWYSPEDLTTHVLTAGATGTGKSVSASIFVEEALKKGIPAVVFDPTVQWTGFVRACKDPNLLGKYREFNIKKEEARPFRGLIYDVETPDIKIDFKKYMNPGEITVFCLAKLKPGEYDRAVENIVNTIFHEKWEESPDLKLLVVFDEVHRLLEKYGGQGGYLALEKACREFRKWGIGLIMCSQVSADFKEAVQGNILTEIQLNTKSMEDIKKIEQKYGKEFAKRISREAVGVGMVQNPKYNDGKPWFIQFRPTLHSPHKITEEELEQYKSFASTLDEIENKVQKAKDHGTDTFDIELELKLAKNKLKEGRFKMAEIYISSLKDRLRTWKI